MINLKLLPETTIFIFRENILTVNVNIEALSNKKVASLKEHLLQSAGDYISFLVEIR